MYVVFKPHIIYFSVCLSSKLSTYLFVIEKGREQRKISNSHLLAKTKDTFLMKLPSNSMKFVTDGQLFLNAVARCRSCPASFDIPLHLPPALSVLSLNSKLKLKIQ